MPSRYEWQSRIKAIGREFRVVRQSLERLSRQAKNDPTILQNERVQLADVVDAMNNVESTYFIRLLAEFESGIWQYWQTIRQTSVSTYDLMESLAARRPIPDWIRVQVHVVREYRNSLVHEHANQPEPISLDVAKSRLCTFF